MFKSPPVPILRIFDLDKALEFYVGFLGFEEEFRHQFEPGTPYYLGLHREGVRLHLSEHFGDSAPGAHFRIEVADLDAFVKALNEKKYRHARPGAQEQPWGTKESTIDDPFGNRVTFWMPLAARAP